jgi:NAD(P)-dependent dehydrogenase (short-subunit alcohol dehydrogenase family)
MTQSRNSQGESPASRGETRTRDEATPRGDTRAPLKEPTPPYKPQHQQAPGVESELQPAPRYEAPRYRPADKLAGQVALITGGDSGIGRAVAVLFAREGADVAISYLPEEQSDAEETRDAVLACGRRCELLPGDLSDAAFCETLVEQTVEKFQRLDVLVSNAAHQKRKTLEELDDTEMRYTFETNILAYMRLARAALRHMKPGASIIATSSETGIKGTKRLPDYSATKGAINAFTKALAIDLLDRQIRVNAVAPGPVWTPLNPSDEGADAEKAAKFGADSPMKRPAQPEELAPAYVFLASNADSSYITGIVLQVMGGETTGG